MNFSELKYLWFSDLYRYTGRITVKLFLRTLVVSPGFKYTFFLRLKKYLGKKGIIMKPLYYLIAIMLLRYSHRIGISIPHQVEIGPGFFIDHYGTIFINSAAKIGRNCSISQGVTIGLANRGKNKGVATLGDDIYIGPGAKIVGAVKIGNNVAIGANCVVTKDIPDNTVVGGVPAKVISTDGIEGLSNYPFTG